MMEMMETMSINLGGVTLIYIASLTILVIGFLAALSSKDLIRLLISLELMFGAVFMALIPMFMVAPDPAFAISIITIFTSAGELLVLIGAIVIQDRRMKNILMQSISAGGDKL